MNDKYDVLIAKEKYAHNHLMKNREQAIRFGMNKKQLEVIEDVCYLRHKIHSVNRESVFLTEAPDHMDYFDMCEGLLELMDKAAGFGLPNFSSRFPNMSDIYALPDDNDWYDLLTEEEQNKYIVRAKEEWAANLEDNGDEYRAGLLLYRDEAMEEIYNHVEYINNQIEKWLRLIDEEYHTGFCPTGWARFYRS